MLASLRGHNNVKEELESIKCYSIEFSGRHCSDTAQERCATEKRNDLLGPEPTTELVTSCLGVPVLSTQKPETKSPRALRSEASSVERQLSFRKPFGLVCKFRTPTATLTRTSSDVSTCTVKTRSLVLERLNGPAGAGGEAHYYGIATEELCYGYTCDANGVANRVT